MVPARSHKVSRVSWYSGYRHVSSNFVYGIFTLFDWLSQNHSASLCESIMRSEPRSARTPVCPLSISLAATLEIDFSFFSSGYLDVSVHRVPFSYTIYSYMDDRSSSCRVSPFRNLRVVGYLLLTAAYRSLSRLSSALSAKASTLRSYWLDLLDGMYSVTYLHGFGSLSQLTLLRPSSNKNSCVSSIITLKDNYL